MNVALNELVTGIYTNTIMSPVERYYWKDTNQEERENLQRAFV